MTATGTKNDVRAGGRVSVLLLVRVLVFVLVVVRVREFSECTQDRVST